MSNPLNKVEASLRPTLGDETLIRLYAAKSGMTPIEVERVLSLAVKTFVGDEIDLINTAQVGVLASIRGADKRPLVLRAVLATVPASYQLAVVNLLWGRRHARPRARA